MVSQRSAMKSFMWKRSAVSGEGHALFGHRFLCWSCSSLSPMSSLWAWCCLQRLRCFGPPGQGHLGLGCQKVLERPQACGRGWSGPALAQERQSSGRFALSLHVHVRQQPFPRKPSRAAVESGVQKDHSPPQITSPRRVGIPAHLPDERVLKRTPRSTFHGAPFRVGSASGLTVACKPCRTCSPRPVVLSLNPSLPSPLAVPPAPLLPPGPAHLLFLCPAALVAHTSLCRSLPVSLC